MKLLTNSKQSLNYTVAKITAKYLKNFHFKTESIIKNTIQLKNDIVPECGKYVFLEHNKVKINTTTHKEQLQKLHRRNEEC